MDLLPTDNDQYSQHAYSESKPMNLADIGEKSNDDILNMSRLRQVNFEQIIDLAQPDYNCRSRGKSIDHRTGKEVDHKSQSQKPHQQTYPSYHQGESQHMHEIIRRIGSRYRS